MPEPNSETSIRANGLLEYIVVLRNELSVHTCQKQLAKGDGVMFSVPSRDRPTIKIIKTEFRIKKRKMIC